jgi:lantibiotic biosynthesis protein
MTLDGDLRLSAGNVLFDIAEALPPPGSETSGFSLAGGEAGFALFHAYLTKSGLLPPDRVERHRDLTFAHLQSAVDQLPAGTAQLNLYSSFVGVAWAAQHTQALGILQDSDDLCDAADEAVLEGLEIHASSMLCELITGLSGIGVYGLSRWSRPAGRKIVERVVRALEENSVLHQGRRTWFNSPDQLSEMSLRTTPQGCFNLGLSHGVPGALVFLAGAAARGVQGARDLLIDAREWLLLQQRPFQNGSRFGYAVVDGQDEEIEGSRVGWCYGDLGLSAALLLVARKAQRADWEPVALDLARNLARRSVQDSGVKDAALCHGAFGNAHIFARLYAATRERSLHEAALHWLRAGLSMRKEGTGAAGFLTWFPPQPEEPSREPWIPCHGFLEGISGIGLALTGFLAPVEPAWDEVLMVNVPAAGA